MAFKNISYLNGEKLFTAYWKDMGGSTLMGGAASYRKMVNYAVANGMSNPVSGKPPTYMGIWKAMWRWAINNQDMAFELAKEAFFTRGEVLTRERWNSEMLDKVKTSWQSENYTEKWTKKNA
jgi:hypothetical protein